MDFVCRRCGNCCRWPGYVRLTEAETVRMAGCLGMTVEAFTAEYTRLTADRRNLSLTEKPDGSCVFLETGTDGLPACRVQEAKPVQCRSFPGRWNFPGWERECAGAGKRVKQAKDGEMGKRGVACIVSGPSGVGKSTVLGRVRQSHPEWEFSVSCTTRPPRTGEIDHVHYHFITPDDFEDRVQRGEFLEHAGVFAKRYGTLKREVLDRVDAGKSVFLDIDVQGAMQIRRLLAEDAGLRRVVRMIFIAPPSFAVLERRLRSRATDAEEQITLRLAEAKHELSFWSEYDFLIVNDALDPAVASLEGLIDALQLSTSLWPKERFDE